MPHVPPIDVVHLRPLASGLARRIARQPADVDDLIQVGLFAYFVDYPRHLKRSRRIAPLTEKKAWAFARFVLRRAMMRYYGSIMERTSVRNASLDEGMGSALIQYASDSHQRQNDLLEMTDYLDALERTCGRQARIIAQNLIEPMGECAVQLMKIVRKKQRAQRNGYDHSHPRVRFSHQAVRDAMQLSAPAWAEHIERIKGFTREWISKTA